MATSTPSQQAASPEKPATPNVHVLNASEVEKRSWRAQKRRRRLTWTSFVLCVMLPILAISTYYLAIASDRYAVETKFAIRSPGGAAASDIMGIMSGFSTATSTITDSYMVVDFIKSRDLVDRLEQRIDIPEMFSRADADFFMRLPENATREDIVDYFLRVTSIYFDNSSQILTLEVQAFTPDDAQRLSAAIIDIVGDLVNEVSERARADTMRSAEREVARIEAMLREHRRALTAFRQVEQDVDPTASAGAQIRLVGELEGQLASMRARLASVTGFLNEDAPSVRVLRSQIAALERQLDTQRARFGTGGGLADDPEMPSPAGAPDMTMTLRVGTYEDLAVDLEFLQQAYVTALASREAARIEADRAQRYLALFVRPSLPEKSVYPKRVQNILVFSGFAIMLWGIGLMIVYIVREHSS